MAEARRVQEARGSGGVDWAAEPGRRSRRLARVPSGAVPGLGGGSRARAGPETEPETERAGRSSSSAAASASAGPKPGRKALGLAARLGRSGRGGAP